LPYQFVRERYIWKREAQSPFVQNATIFEDIVVRCVRYAFASIPARIDRVFFSKWVALPFFRFRLLRHGYLTSPIPYTEIDRNGVRGLWISGDDRPAELEKPDLVVYYLHGGGFSMGSTYFYLEFLIAWITMLKVKGFRYPAIFALEYSLVPDEVWPQQFEETRAGYRFLCDYLGDGSRICVSGDSAGATLILSLLLRNGRMGEPVSRPGLALLLSPWTHLVSELNQNTQSDYLDSDSLHLYARQYAGKASVDDAVISPGRTHTGWQVSAPVNGYLIMFGAEEVFAPGIQEMVKSMKRSGASVETAQEDMGIHAWPVVDLFLADSPKDRLRGVRQMTEVVYSKMGPK
jgi:acetyl esterase/lipase